MYGLFFYITSILDNVNPIKSTLMSFEGIETCMPLVALRCMTLRSLESTYYYVYH